jgi:sugar phosphate isomerase/epimerase
MKTGLRLRNLSRDVAQALKISVELGVEGIQIHPDEANLYGATDDELLAFKARVEDAGLAIVSSNSGPNLVDPALIETSLEQFQKLFHAAALMGYRLVTGEVKTLGPGQSVEDGWRRCVENVRRVCETADREGAVFCLEPWPPNLVRTTEDLERLIEAVDNPRMRVNLDGGNLWGAGSDSVEAARRLGPLVAHVHVKDWDRRLGPETKMYQPAVIEAKPSFQPVLGETVLGEGQVDWAAIIGELRRAGYDGWLVLERNRSDDRASDARKGLERLGRILADVREV